MDSLKIKFTHSNTVRDNKPYTIYEIELRSSSTITWVIYKRYSHFDTLHQSILKSPTISTYTKMRLPTLPPKRLTRSLASEFVEKRKAELEAYLCQLVEINELLHHPIVVAFLEVPESVKPMLLGSTLHSSNVIAANGTITNNTNTINSQSTGMGGGMGMHTSTIGTENYSNIGVGNYNELIKFYGMSYNRATLDERKIYELCYELRINNNKVSAIKQYEDYFFSSRPKLNSEAIKLLLTGKNSDTVSHSDEYSHSETIGTGTNTGTQQSPINNDSSVNNLHHQSTLSNLHTGFTSIDLNDRNDDERDDATNTGTDTDTERQRRKRAVGLIQICGDITYSHVASRSALLLLCRLLNVEKNKDAALFLDVFCNLEISMLRQLSLADHILSDRGDRMAAFQIAHILKTYEKQKQLQQLSQGKKQQSQQQQSHQSHRRNESSMSMSMSISTLAVENDILYAVITNHDALKEYNRWAEHLASTTNDPTTHQQQPIDPTLKALPLDVNGGYKQIAQQIFQSIMSVYNDRIGYRIVSPVGSLPKMSDINEQVCVSYKRDPHKDMVIVKCSCIIPYNVNAVASVIGNVGRRKEWDLKFHKGHLLQALDDHHDVLHLVFKSFSSPYKFRDFVVLQAYTETQEGGYVQAVRSVLHSAMPDSTEHVRAILYPTGYIVTPLQNQPVNIHTMPNKSSPTSSTSSDNNVSPAYPYLPSPATGHRSAPPSPLMGMHTMGMHPLTTSQSQRHLSSQRSQHPHPHTHTHHQRSATSTSTSYYQQLPPVIETVHNEASLLTFVAQMDKESILIVSPDLLGESNELRQNFTNIKSLLARDFGIRSLVASQHTQNLLSPNNIQQTHVKTEAKVGSINQREGVQPITPQNRNTPSHYANPLPLKQSILESVQAPVRTH